MNTYRVSACIDLDAFDQNIREIKGRIGREVMLMGVVKTNAYGHGALVLSRELESLGCDWLAVATVEEGIELRRGGIHLPVLLLGYTCAEQYPQLLEYDITPAVFSYEMAREMNAAAQAAGKILRVHIKLDTGMRRIGFPITRESEQDILAIGRLPYLNVEGMFTHFPCADMLEDPYPRMTREQYEQYSQMDRWLVHDGMNIPLHHCSNSAGIIDFTESHRQMVRAGIIMYGLYPSGEMQDLNLRLQPVMSLKSHVTMVKAVPEGTGVSYGHTYVTRRPTVIATVPVGYGDGYPRLLSNQGRVLIHGQKVPIIGRVCMDQFMVDVTELKDVLVGDEVILAGSDKDERITMDDLAGQAGTISYEIVSDIGRRVPRVYVRGGRPIAISTCETITKEL